MTDPVELRRRRLITLVVMMATIMNALDGTIEAIEMPSHRWLIAVQWHPELSAASDPLQQKLFDALVEEAGK